MLVRVVPALAAVLGLLVVSACAGERTLVGEPTPEPTGTAIPDTVVGEQIRWVLDQLAADSGPEPAEAEERFAESFLAEVGPDQISGVFDQLRALGPWQLNGVTGDDHYAEAAVRNGADEPWLMTISVDPDGRISTLLLGPDPVADRTPAASLDALMDEFAGLAEQVGFLAARVEGDSVEGDSVEGDREGDQVEGDQVEGDRCVPVAERNLEESLPLGSTFKLYVLGTLADAIIDGTGSWDDTVTVTDDLRSLPTGRLQDEPEGTEVTLQDAAQGMISISDNTATDLIIDWLGRDRAAAAQKSMGHADPERNDPFLTTRELFPSRLGRSAVA